jgi:hypothetical protein
MARRKTYPVSNLKETKRRWISFVIVFAVIAFLMTFDVIAKAVSKGLNQIGIKASYQDVQDVAVILSVTAVATIVLMTASAFAAVPFVGVGLALIGIGLLAFAGYRAVKMAQRNTRPDPTKIDDE